MSTTDTPQRRPRRDQAEREARPARGAAIEAMTQDVAAWRRRFRRGAPWTDADVEEFVISCGWSSLDFPEDLEEYEAGESGQVWRPKEATKALMRAAFADSDLDTDTRVAAWRWEMGLEPQTEEEFAEQVRRRTQEMLTQHAAGITAPHVPVLRESRSGPEWDDYQDRLGYGL